MDSYRNSDGTFTWYDITPTEFGVIKAALVHAHSFLEIVGPDIEEASFNHFGVKFSDRDAKAVREVLAEMDNYEPIARIEIE